jgi:hypothetical protein
VNGSYYGEFDETLSWRGFLTTLRDCCGYEIAVKDVDLGRPDRSRLPIFEDMPEDEMRPDDILVEPIRDIAIESGYESLNTQLPDPAVWSPKAKGEASPKFFNGLRLSQNASVIFGV